MRLCELWVTIFCCGDEENGRCACTNGNSTTADQSEIRKANLVSVLSDKNVAGKGGYA